MRLPKQGLLFFFFWLMVMGSVSWSLSLQNRAAAAAGDNVDFTVSPDGRWTALINTTTGSLDLQSSDGQTANVFAAGSTVNAVTWSPDSRHLLVVRANWVVNQPEGRGVTRLGPIEIWQVTLGEDRIDAPRRVYQSLALADEAPQQIIFGHWSPNSQYVLFWEGILSASLLADGLPLSALDISTGQVKPVAEVALLNPRYQSWSPDSAKLAITTGAGREAFTHKWLNLWDAASGQVTTVISQTEQIPGVVAWSPQGDILAYAAAPASSEAHSQMTFDNPLIASRRIYLLDPTTGTTRRLNEADTFQDGPLWSSDGEVIYYGQRKDNQLVLMAADPDTGQAEAVPNAAIPLPEFIGYYGQWEQDALLEKRFQEWRPDCP